MYYIESVSESSPGGEESPDQTWNFEFENYVIIDVNSVRDAKHHYLKFLLIRFSCKALVERIFNFFMIFNTSKISVFAPPGAPGGAKFELCQLGKKYFLLKKFS